MHISKVNIKGFRCFRDFSLEFNSGTNIIVGDNGTGKSTILDAIHLCLSGLHRGVAIRNILSSHIFNSSNVQEYLDACVQPNSQLIELPKICIEVFLEGTTCEEPILALLRGSDNSEKLDASGVKINIEFDDDYKTEYEALCNDKSSIKSIPIEYYKCVRSSFARAPITNRSIPLKSLLVDTSAIVNSRSSIDVYLNRMLNDILDPKDRASLSGAFRQMKEDFSDNEVVMSIVDKYQNAERDFALGIDPSVNANWESLLIAKVNNIPFQYVGKGEQCITKTFLSLNVNSEESRTLLIEEPENHLSYTKLNSFLDKIRERNKKSQIIITTHSSMVCNKLDLGNLILLSKEQTHIPFKNINEGTRRFFAKLSGYDTLRVILSECTILVEGPCDDLIVQKAYLKEYGKLPIKDGVDIISVSGISFKRYLNLVSGLANKVAVITDNDGNFQDKKGWYREYENDTIKIFMSDNNNCPTLEPQIFDANKGNLKILSSTIGYQGDESGIADFMKRKKTDCALAIFDSKENILIPSYIIEAIKWIKTNI